MSEFYRISNKSKGENNSLIYFLKNQVKENVDCSTIVCLVQAFMKNKRKEELEKILKDLDLTELYGILKTINNISCFNPQFCILLSKVSQFLREYIAKIPGGTDSLYT